MNNYSNTNYIGILYKMNVLLFPGQGSQKVVGMGEEFYKNFEK